MTTEPTTPLTSEIHALLTLSLRNSKALKGTHAKRAQIIMDDLADAGLCITTMAPPKEDTDPEPDIQTMHTDDNGHSHGISLPCTLGRDQEAREGLVRELIVADVDTFTEPRRVAIDYQEERDTNPRELGWFDVRTMVRQLAEFAPDLVVMRREDVPEVTITENLNAPTTCTVDIGGVRRFAGTSPAREKQSWAQLREQLAAQDRRIAELTTWLEALHPAERIRKLLALIDGTDAVVTIDGVEFRTVPKAGA